MPDQHSTLKIDEADVPHFIAGFALVIVILTILAYWPALQAGFIWDDQQYVWGNPLLLDGTGLRQIWLTPTASPQYYPVVFTTFWIEHKLWGFDARGYHWVNVILHGLNALLVWRICLRLRISGSWLIGAVFALHPVHVESVAWITERKNVQSGFFYLSAMLGYLQFDERRGTPQERKAWFWYAAALAMFILALLSKSVTCSLPAALMLVMLWQRKPLTWKKLAPLIPLFAIGLYFGLNTARLERDHVMAVGPDFDFSMAERVLIASNALLFYAGKLLWPHPLVFVYERWVLNAQSILSYWPLALLLCFAALLIVLYVRGIRGPALALAFFAGTLFPALGFFNVYPMIFSFVADHFQYLASLGVIVLVVGSLARWLADQQRVAALGVIILPTLLWLTSQQSAIYQNLYTLWTHTIARNENAWLARTNLAPILLQQADIEIASGRAGEAQRYIREARSHAEKAVALKPDHSPALSNYSEALRYEGQFEKSLEAIETAIRLNPRDPNYHFQRGRLLEALNLRFEAVEAYRKAIELDPSSFLFRAMLVHALINRQNMGEAVRITDSMIEESSSRQRSLAEIDIYSLEMLAAPFARAGEPDVAARTIDAAIALAQRHDMTDHLSALQKKRKGLSTP
jgi:protein O-mannosyl-transferase